ncbi:proteasome subunit alpha type-2-like [Drosophila sulfurigaster albostrigata]|uniref:proteasome subunit alpha type-2-like n=1 Tax=Drosophila sulfurigaster albostrigata TaxID=89887 RepID=UPI002D2188E3|nr:proteasome subunit alpha type-2-like [Drosophila sulfurigaster albostrigata]
MNSDDSDMEDIYEVDLPELLEELPTIGSEQIVNAEKGAASNDEPETLQTDILEAQIQQLNFAEQVMNNDLPTIAIATQSSVVIVAAKMQANCLVVCDSIMRMENISKYIAIAYAGLAGDFRELTKSAVKLYYDNVMKHNAEIRGKQVANDLRKTILKNAQLPKLRPFAIQLLIGNWSNDHGHLHQLDSYGTLKSPNFACIGRNAKEANEYLKKVNLSDTTTVESTILFGIHALTLALETDVVCPFELDVGIIDCKGFRYLSKEVISENLYTLFTLKYPEVVK